MNVEDKIRITAAKIKFMSKRTTLGWTIKETKTSQKNQEQPILDKILKYETNCI
jgi:hypothetical protein